MWGTKARISKHADALVQAFEPIVRRFVRGGLELAQKDVQVEHQLIMNQLQQMMAFISDTVMRMEARQINIDLNTKDIKKDQKLLDDDFADSFAEIKSLLKNKSKVAK
ncbi:unnamed protein product [marine sediment metagenome]|uniref:Uncharacterized protein n=1 Tax=marine sediment metagenome TaxID=412755 RepID=X0RGQ4_9ZZZZ